MITKWFIQDKNRKSLGFYKCFENTLWRKKTNIGRPAFTKQTALATFFKSEQDAIDHLETVGKNLQTNIKEINRKLKTIDELKGKWSTLGNQEKINLVADNDIQIQYKEKSQWGRSYIKRFHATKYIYSKTNIKQYDDLNDSEKEAIKSPDWDASISPIEEPLTMYEAQFKYLTDYLRPFEQTIEFKFKDNERKRIEWRVRDDNETSYDYCNGCGGAIPGIPQVRIGWETTLCAICMSKLAQEAQIQMGKVPEDVVEHYETDRFLRQV